MGSSDFTHGTDPTLAPGEATPTGLLCCSKCGAYYEVRNWAPDRAVRCPTCSVDLVPPRIERVLDAGEPIAPGNDAGEGKPFGRYRLLSQLGHGGMGVVWKAWDSALRRHVAIKGILAFGEADRTQVERFQREAQAAARLRHPSIVTVHDVGVVEGQHYICADFVEGVSLDKRTGEAWPVRKALELVRCVAEALQYAHDQGIVHRDVKPANILLDASERPFVADFGLAKDVKGPDATAITGSGELLGTPSYMSPEQARGQAKNTGPASDQFSLGVVLYELLTGRRPFSAESQLGTMKAIVELDPARPTSIQPKIHRDVETICLKALEKEPMRRYARIGDLAADIGRYLDGEPIEARPIGALARIARKASRYRAILIPTALAAVLAVVAAMGAGMAREAKEGEGEARAAQETAERHLKKAKLVADVFGRWSELGPTLREMEKAWYRPGPEGAQQLAVLRTGWAKVERFLEDTPTDSASQATARALAAWARCLAVNADDGLSSAMSASAIDPEVPMGELTASLIRFVRVVETQTLPRIVEESRGYRFGDPPPITEEWRREQEAIERHIVAAERRPVWGREGAAAFRAAVQGLRAFQRGDYAEAERGFEAALASVDLRAFQTGMRFAVGQCRYMRKAYREAIAELEEVRKARPESGAVLVYLGDLHRALAHEAAMAGRDPRTELSTAIEAYDSAVKACEPAGGADPGLLQALGNRGLALTALAQAEWDRGIDPGPSVARAVESLDRACATAPQTEWNQHVLRGMVRSWHGTVLDQTGRDPFPSFEQAISDFGEALARRPGDASALLDRGVCWERRARAESARGRDPSESFEKAIQDASMVLVNDPGDVVALNNRGSAWSGKASADEERGLDPTDSLAKSRADTTAAVKGLPDFDRALQNLGILLRKLAVMEAARGGDPGPLLDDAIARFDLAVQARPGNPAHLSQRGTTLSRRAEFAAARGADPIPDFEAAARDFEASARVNPRRTQTWVDCGNLWFRRAEWERSHGAAPRASLENAAAKYETAIELNGKNADALSGRANVRVRMVETGSGSPEEVRSWVEAAIQDYGRALEARPENAVLLQNRAGVWFVLAQVLTEAGEDPREAFRNSIRDMGAAIGRNPRDADPFSGRAKAHACLSEAERLRGGDPLPHIDRAIEDAGTALRLRPGDAEMQGLLDELGAARARFQKDGVEVPGSR